MERRQSGFVHALPMTHAVPRSRTDHTTVIEVLTELGGRLACDIATTITTGMSVARLCAIPSA